MCPVVPLPEDEQKACSGKCRETCSRKAFTQIIAASEGLISLFKKQHGEEISPVEETKLVSSTGEFCEHIRKSIHSGAFDQLVIVGSPNDIAWVRASLPEEAAKYVTAEIQYPLVTDWLRHTDTFPNLTQALRQLFKD